MSELRNVAAGLSEDPNDRAARSPYAVYPSLRGRVVMITGGASGIGEAIVEAFVRQGSRAIFLDIQREAGQALVERLRPDADIVPWFVPCDLRDSGILRSTLQAVMERLDGERLAVDVLVNNAADDTRHGVEEVTPELWDQLMAANLKHQFFMTQGVLKSMRSRGRGSIINMSSISWMIPPTGLPVYIAAKAAIVGMTRTLAHELGGDNIRVNAVLPGAIITERQRRMWLTDEYKAAIMQNQALKRFIAPEEVARLVLFLAADDSAAITSQSYVIDAGWV